MGADVDASEVSLGRAGGREAFHPANGFAGPVTGGAIQKKKKVSELSA